MEVFENDNDCNNPLNYFKDTIKDSKYIILSISLTKNSIANAINYYVNKIKEIVDTSEEDDNENLFNSNFKTKITEKIGYNSLKTIKNINYFETLSKSISKEKIDTIISHIRKTEKPSLSKICFIYNKLYPNIKIGKSSINNFMKLTGYTYKKFQFIPGKTISEEMNKQIVCFSLAYKFYLMHGYEIITIDESSMGGYLKYQKNWQLESEKVAPFKKTKISKASLIMAISTKKIIKFTINEKNTNSDIFFTFMRQLDEFLKSNDEFRELYERRKILVYYDNAKYHLVKKKLKEFSNTKLLILTNAPYKPTYSSIELIFSFIKNKMYNLVADSILTRYDTLIEAIMSLKEETIIKFHKRCLVNIKEDLSSILNNLA